MKRLIIALAASAAAIIGVVPAAQAADAKKVCFVYVGTRTDGGWTQAHDIGRQELQKHFGDKIETPFLESVPEGPDAERAIERMARSGCDLIFTTSFGFMDATGQGCAEVPEGEVRTRDRLQDGGEPRGPITLVSMKAVTFRARSLRRCRRRVWPATSPPSRSRKW